MSLLESPSDLSTLCQVRVDRGTELAAANDLIRVREALAALQQPGSTAQLIDRATAAGAALGFDRMMFTWIQATSWIPWSVSVPRDPGWAEDILRAARGTPPPLGHQLVESEILRRKTGITVLNVQHHPRVHRAMARVSRCGSYVAVPVTLAGCVVGLLHADRYYQRREVTDRDNKLLMAFAEGLGLALGQALLLDRIASLRGDLGAVSDLSVAARATTASWPLDSVAQTLSSGHAAIPQRPRGPLERLTGVVSVTCEELTHREVDVIRLVARGYTNGQVARRLAISEGTTKSHVKRILRKLGAANRAQAVSRWISLQAEVR